MVRARLQVQLYLVTIAKYHEPPSRAWVLRESALALAAGGGGWGGGWRWGGGGLVRPLNKHFIQL